MNLKKLFQIFLFTVASTSVLYAQKAEEGKQNFNKATLSVQEKLEKSIEELNAVREQAAEETIPLSRKLSKLESDLVDVRLEYQNTTRMLDTRTLDLTNLNNEIKTRTQEATYLSNLLGEYIRKFESRLHITELKRYDAELEVAKLAPENDTLSEEEVFAAQAQLIDVSMKRLEEALGGTTFTGTAVDPEGMVTVGDFALMGPTAIFRSEDGSIVGSAEQRLGSLEPTVIPYNSARDTLAAAKIILEGEGFFPVDPTLGNAHKIEETEETFLEHVKKGGPVMYPIFGMAGAALLVALFKWLGFSLVRQPTQARIKSILKSLSEHDDETLQKHAREMRQPDHSRDWIGGAIAGVIFGLLLHTILQFQIAAPVAGWLGQYIPVNSSFLVYMAVFGILCAGIQYILRFAFGYSPVGTMLAAAIDHTREPSELIEEVMYEKVLATRLRLERFLPFIAISAAAAPLLGLLGTVTGIINTFKLITVFGSGDVKTLSSGISEALVTTEFGLIVAIPSLLIHAFLSRKARSIINDMEQAAVAFLNQLGKTPYRENKSLQVGKLKEPVSRDDERISTISSEVTEKTEASESNGRSDVKAVPVPE